MHDLKAKAATRSAWEEVCSRKWDFLLSQLALDSLEAQRASYQQGLDVSAQRSVSLSGQEYLCCLVRVMTTHDLGVECFAVFR